MLEFLGGLFSQNGIAKKGAEMLDEAFYTGQEKSTFLLEYIRISATPMAITRRFLACMVGFLWGLSAIIAAVLYLIESEMYQGWSDYMTLHINEPFKWVMGFYFLYKVFQR